MDKVIGFLTEEIELNDKDIVVIGCSGGPDSMALMNIMINIRKKKNILLVCAHINHNVRVESKQEEEFIKEFCSDNNIIFETMEIVKYSGDNFHNQARKIRYSFFEEIAYKYKANYLMTAHHGDDLIETVLMRIVRGSTLKGYSGFGKIVKKDNYTILRPLIYVTKQQIKKYNEKHQIKYVTDSSNSKDTYTRNRYRKKILPSLKEEDAFVHEKFLKFSNILTEYDNYISKEINKIINDIYNDKKVNIIKLKQQDLLIQKRIISYVLEDIYGADLYQVSNTHIDSIIKLTNSKRANCYLNLPNDIKAVKEYDLLIVTNEVTDIESYKKEINEIVILPTEYKIRKLAAAEGNGNDICRLDSSEISLPLYVRNRENGDKISLKKIEGTKKIKDIFIESKVPLSERGSWPVVVDSKGMILWIPNLKKSNFTKQKLEKHDIILRYEWQGGKK